MANNQLFYKALMVDAKMYYLTKYNYLGATLDYLRKKPDVVVDLYVAYRSEEVRKILKQRKPNGI